MRKQGSNARRSLLTRPVWRAAIAALFWLALWVLAARAVGLPLLLPTPWAVLARLAALCMQVPFWQAVGASMGRAVVGYAWGVGLGAVLAAGTCAWPLLDALLRPALRAIRAMPVASFIILALVWMGSDRVPVLTGALMVLPVVWGNVAQGIEAVDGQLLEMARVFRFSPMRRVRRVVIPSVLPTFLAACETAMGLCWKASIAAEVLGVPRRAIGTQLYQAKIYLETDALLAWTLAVVVLSVVLERAFALGVRVLRAPRAAEGGTRDAVRS